MPMTSDGADIAITCLLDFVAFNGGKDVTSLWLEDGSPDIDGARRYAEGVRRQAKKQQAALTVEQRVNKVTVSIPGDL